MRLEFTRSAARHGISRERAAYVIEHCSSPLYDPAWFGATGGVLFLGFDWNGVPLEVGAVERDDGDLLVMHAMPVRRSYRAQLEEVIRWRES